MKNWIFTLYLILALGTSCFLNAQDFLSRDNFWVYQSIHGNGQLEYIPFYYKIGKDTLIDNQIYVQVLWAIQGDTPLEWKASGHLRQDGEQLWSSYPRLIYDFGISVGDTLNRMILVAVDTVMHNDGTPIRRQSFIPVVGVCNTNQVWEGIGSSFWPFGPLCVDLPSTFFSCFFENGQLMLEGPENETRGIDCLDYLPIVNNTSRPKTITHRIYPNPFQSTLTLELGDYSLDQATLRIWNKLGQEVYHEIGLSGQRLQLETNFIQHSGLFWLTLEEQGTTILSKALIKH